MGLKAWWQRRKAARKEQRTMSDEKALRDAKAKAQAEREARAQAAVLEALLRSHEAVKGEDPTVLVVVAVTPAGTFSSQAYTSGAIALDAMERAKAHLQAQINQRASVALPARPQAAPPVPTPKGVVELKGVPSAPAEG